MNVRTFLETFFSFRLVIVANSPVDSAIVKPNSDTSNVPKGAKLIKFLVQDYLKNSFITVEIMI